MLRSVLPSRAAGLLAAAGLAGTVAAGCATHNDSVNGGQPAAESIAPSPPPMAVPPAGSGAAAGEVVETQQHSYRVVTVAEGLEHPWSIAFLPGGDMLVTERPGRLRIVRNGSLLPDPVAGLPEVRAGGQGGLMEVLPHPDFANNRLLYIANAKPRAEDSQRTTAVARGRFENDRLVDVEDIFVADAWTAAGQHFGGKLAFDRDGYLFVTIGDRGASPMQNVREHPSQSTANHQGTIVRLHDDGRVPQDNPFVGRQGARPEIWSYGHRNPQGFVIHPQTGDIWSTEHGPQGGDELNLVRPGLNYGWPVVGHGVQYGGRPIHEGAREAGMEDPVHHWTPSIAVSGLIVYTGDAFPNWRGNLLAGGLAAETIRRVVLDGQRVVMEEPIFEGQGRVRDIRQGPDGFIYIAIDHRGGQPTAVVRLEPTR
jgi:aldose sugar dehydrogenase